MVNNKNKRQFIIFFYYKSNLESLKNSIDFKLSNFIVMMTRGISCLIYSLIAGFKFSIIFFALVPFMILSLYFMIHYIKKFAGKESISYGNSGNVAQEALINLKTVISFGIHRKTLNDYKLKLADSEKASINRGKYKGFFEGAFFFTFAFMFGSMIYWSVYLFQFDCVEYTQSLLVSCSVTIVIGSFMLAQAIPFVNDIAVSKIAAKKLFDTIEVKSNIDIRNSKEKKLPILKGEIQFEDVHFNYPARPDSKILQGFNLNIPAGKTIAFCGPRYLYYVSFQI